MATRNSTSPLLLGCIFLLTFPLWIGLVAGAFGIVAGVFGATLGIIGGIFGVMVGIIVLPFRILFGWGSWHHWGWFPHFHFHGFFFLVLIVIVAAFIVKRKR